MSLGLPPQRLPSPCLALHGVDFTRSKNLKYNVNNIAGKDKQRQVRGGSLLGGISLLPSSLALRREHCVTRGYIQFVPSNIQKSLVNGTACMTTGTVVAGAAAINLYPRFEGNKDGVITRTGIAMP